MSDQEKEIVKCYKNYVLQREQKLKDQLLVWIRENEQFFGGADPHECVASYTHRYELWRHIQVEVCKRLENLPFMPSGLVTTIIHYQKFTVIINTRWQLDSPITQAPPSFSFVQTLKIESGKKVLG